MSPAADLVPLAERSAALQGIRLVLAAAVVLAVRLPDVAVSADVDLTSLAVAYAVATSVIELIRRTVRRRALPIVSAMLLVDGLFLAAVIAETGGSASHLLFLAHLHVVAAVLLATFRSGLVVAGWHGLLLVAAQHAAWIGGAPAPPAPPDLLVVASLLLVAVVAVAVARINERALRRSRRAADSLVELGGGLERSRRVHDVAHVAAGHLTDVLGYRRSAVLLAGPAAWTGAVGGADGVLPVVVSGSAPDAATGVDPVLAAHLDPTDDAALATVLPGACHVVITPLVADHQLVGVLAVECGPGRADLPSDELGLLGATAERVAMAVRTAGLLTEVERLATSDALTGLANRRLFDQTMTREVARARRAHTPLALAVVDVDHFKAVNDDHGHQVGDAVLRELATALLSAVRAEDLLARYGGEEFVVLMTGATIDDAVVVAERLRMAARRVTAVPVTISIGVAELGAAGDGSALVADADAALYRAKESGRDRTVRHDATSAPAPPPV